jgi:hypothetical protein
MHSRSRRRDTITWLIWCLRCMGADCLGADCPFLVRESARRFIGHSEGSRRRNLPQVFEFWKRRGGITILEFNIVLSGPIYPT